ncbi:MAG: hypothetical protein EXX96DRAFT_561518 [Benjaminiella poitrasii]|nr:MAG: hypothetical protein EXX96DRAFT_561518 [Benjaminiella poitrasii]
MFSDNTMSKENSPPLYKLPPIQATSHIPTPLPSIKHEPSAFYPFHQPPPPPPSPPPSSQQQLSTYSYSPYLKSYNDFNQLEEYPHYNYEDMPIVNNPTLKKKKDMDERMQNINREFLENNEMLYEEKIKQLQDELKAVEKGRHEIYEELISDLEEKRKKTIDDARSMMIYQILCVDKQFYLDSKIVQEESMAERRELQNAMFLVIDEKRRKLKEDKDGEGEVGMSAHQTRNRKRMLRKRGDFESIIGNRHTSTNNSKQKRKQDRMREIPSHLIDVLSKRIEEDVEADFYAMKKKR